MEPGALYPRVFRWRPEWQARLSSLSNRDRQRTHRFRSFGRDVAIYMGQVSLKTVQ